ncbi:hypothetical protein PAXRUDRAFT_22188 [Paxillus rubicundulus Ve08.2h10]|uniref:Uncharacterized protein n=1 Tax=Paxillus rubicundulus Ve08.2h10 TaxID=930991 RepID=A0A0D0CNH2_9AGAM|nr:hypothetical protein PAXRUDRAFT_22188 [Paxillus rubicundulus Ve08.2h10]
MEYAKKSLGDSASDEEESQTDMDSNSDSGPVERKKRAKKGKKAKVNAVLMVSHIGKAWIGDIKDASLDVMKHMVRAFITFHYRQASRVKNGVVPWMQISTQRSDYISGKYLPQGAKLREHSKLQKKEVISLLEFWRDRQRLDLADVFTFRRWRDATGSCRDPVEVYSDEEGASQRRTAAKGKRKVAPDHWPTDTKESEDDQGGVGSKHLDMGKQARGRGLVKEGSEEEEADGRRRTWSEVVSNPKDSRVQRARKIVREKKSNGKDGQEAPKPIAKPRPGRSRRDSSTLPKSRQDRR